MVRKKITKKRIRDRKGYLPGFLAILFLWALVFFTIYFIDPSIILVVPMFFVLVFLTIFLTVSIGLVNNGIGLITAISSTMFLALRYFGIGNVLNLFLIIGLSIATVIYFRNY